MIREIIKLMLLISILTFGVSCKTNILEKEVSIINTVGGPIEASNLGVALSHEHIMSNYGKDINLTSVYDTDRLLHQVIPYLKRLKKLGVTSIFDCTTAYFGRRVDLLKNISESTGIRIITNTGFYGAANDRYIPEFAYGMWSEDISKIWISEFQNGIDDTNIRPGFIKLAFDGGDPSDIDRKLFEAGLLTHLSTGLAMAVHTGDNRKAIDLQLDLLEQYGVHPSAWIWVHANKSEDDDILIEVARKGGWISLDGVKNSNMEEYVKRLQLFKSQNLLHKILLSHDGNGFPSGGAIREFEALLVDLVPTLRKSGFSENEIKQLTENNSAAAFGIRIRR